MALRNIIKKRGIPLNIVSLSTNKKLKIQHVSANIRTENANNQNEGTVPDHTHEDYCNSCENEEDSNEIASSHSY